MEHHEQPGRPHEGRQQERERSLITLGRVLFTAVLCAGILGFGVLGAIALVKLRRPPAEADGAEQFLRVEVIEVQREDVPVIIPGLGQARSLDIASVAPEVAGTVVEVHPRLDVGEVIPKGETLFVIDPRTYKASADGAKAQASQLENTLASLRTQFATDRERLATLRRTHDLAKAEFERKQALFQEDEVGTLSAVEATEQAYNAATDAVDLMEQALATYPFRIKEVESGLAAARAGLASADVNLERTRIVAPFDARVKSGRVDVGQYVSPGIPVLELADDRILEVSVPIDSRDARTWLQFNGQSPVNGAAWFTQVEPVTCTIRWTENTQDHTWDGTLSRVEKFDEATRTVYVAVRVEDGGASSAKDRQLPLVDGMFCRVEIPGRVLKGVYQVPEWAVSYQQTVYRVEDGRLRTIPVEVAYERGEHKFVSAGLTPGDLIVTTRLVNPLEGTLLEIVNQDPSSSEPVREANAS